MANFTSRMEELEAQFAALGPALADGPQKQALSVLHGMILELRRERAGSGPESAEASVTRIANLHRNAPPMEGEALARGLAVGERAPDFDLPDAAGRRVRLTDRLGRGRSLVLVFYPLDWSPTCSNQLTLYQADLAEFERLRAEVIGISVDSLYSHGAWAAVHGLSLPLLADFAPRGETARRYGVMREGDGHSERALFVVDSQGIVRHAHVSPRLNEVPDIYALFEQLSALAGEGRDGAK